MSQVFNLAGILCNNDIWTSLELLWCCSNVALQHFSVKVLFLNNLTRSLDNGGVEMGS